MFIGLDFGTLSVRGVAVDTRGQRPGNGKKPRGRVVASHVEDYARCVVEMENGGCLFLDPRVWVSSGERVIEELLAQMATKQGQSGRVKVDGVGVAFTSCTVVPINAHGNPLSNDVAHLSREEAVKRPHLYAKMWKHHSPKAQQCADDLTRAVKKTNAKWLEEYYGGALGLEWLFPKILEVYDEDKEAFYKAHSFVEAGDYVVWALSGAKLPLDQHLVRSTQQAGYKGCFISGKSLISSQLLQSIRPNFSIDDWTRFDISRFPILSPGSKAGMLQNTDLIDTPVSTASIDAHACAFGLGGFCPARFVLVVGTSGCFMISSNKPIPIPGAAGFVPNGIASGLFGFEFGQSACGDVFSWTSRFTSKNVNQLESEAVVLLEKLIREGTSLDCYAIDYLNGARTPLMRGDAKASLHGITLSTTPAHVFLALLEAVCFGIRVVLEMILKAKVPVDDIILAGGLAKSKLFCTVLAATLKRTLIAIDESGDATCRGAAAYASLMSDDNSVLEQFEPESALTILPSAGIQQVIGGDERYSRYVDLAKVRSFI